MMEESPRREYRRSSLNHRFGEYRRPARLPVTVRISSVLIFDRAAQHRSPLWASPDAPPLAKRMPHRAGTRHIAPLAAIHRIVAASRLARARVRSRQQLDELNDHLLKDIGLRREDLGFEAPTPFWHRD
jgi:uncharacterized protein YjiS (DUF1127 family)